MRLLVPGPRGADDGRKIRMGRAEVQRLARGGSVGDQIRWIAGAARLDDVRNVVAGFTSDRRENLAHREAFAGAEVQGAAGMTLQKQFERRGRALRRGR